MNSAYDDTESATWRVSLQTQADGQVADVQFRIERGIPHGRYTAPTQTDRVASVEWFVE
jgi:hypothetical protein